MTKRKIFIGVMALASVAMLASCGLSSKGTNIDQDDTSENSNDNMKEFSVTFVSNGGSTIDSQIVKNGSKVVKPADPTRDGYVFGGWQYNGSSYDFNKSVSENLTLYAKWNTIPKTVKYEIGTPIINQWTDSIGMKWMRYSVPVKNIGTADLYLEDISVDFESEFGDLLQTESYVSSYPEYLKPGETGYYYDETFCDFDDTNVNVVPHVQVKKATGAIDRYEISDVSIKSDSIFGIKITGRVQNNTSEKGSLVIVAANLFDSEGLLICSCFTYLDNDLNPNSKVGFSISQFAYSKFKPSDVARYEIYSYPFKLNI